VRLTSSDRLHLISWALAAVSIALTLGFRSALSAYFGSSHFLHDIAEPFMALWAWSSTATIVLLALAGSTSGSLWRPFAILSLIPIVSLAELGLVNVAGALANGEVSPAGLTAGLIEGAQLAVFLAWLVFIGLSRDTWPPARGVLVLAPAFLLTIGWKLAYSAWYSDQIGVGYWNIDLVGIGPYAWGPASLIAIGTLACASGEQGSSLRSLRFAAMVVVGSLWLMVAVSLIQGVATESTPTIVYPLVVSFAEVVVLTAWLVLVGRWATIPA